ncbi:hypothetical protein KSP40_PGU018094 [Platanthera guangdongensis]|uniref:Tryptophanyl-tRNA synthetase n=1 Tax=Platanthera guangdongensis TaxID=2320717 RepID=A0ABR2MVM3_9ASPA
MAEHDSSVGGLAVESTPVEEESQVVSPWEVSARAGGKIDYDKLIEKFGCQRLDQSLINRVERLTSSRAHVFLRRGVFFAHRDLNEILDVYERGEKFYLYTGRGPSSEALHLGHLVPFMFTNICHIRSAQCLLPNMVRVAKCVTFNKAVPSFPSSFPHLFAGNDNLRCLIPCAIDQDPYFRMTRDVAPRIGYQKPALIESSFFPALQVFPSFGIHSVNEECGIIINFNLAFYVDAYFFFLFHMLGALDIKALFHYGSVWHGCSGRECGGYEPSFVIADLT